MKNCEIVWVFGSSGAGKETFIKYLTNNPSEELINLLGWGSKKIEFCSESIEYVAQFYKDPLGKKREEILEGVLKLVSDNSVILIKGQDLDFKYGRLQKLKKLLPSCKHKIIFLHADTKTLLERWKTKKWWEESYTEQTVIDWLKPQIENILKLKDEFEIIGLNSEDNNTYEITYFPPTLY